LAGFVTWQTALICAYIPFQELPLLGSVGDLVKAFAMLVAMVLGPIACGAAVGWSASGLGWLVGLGVGPVLGVVLLIAGTSNFQQIFGNGHAGTRIGGIDLMLTVGCATTGVVLGRLAGAHIFQGWGMQGVQSPLVRVPLTAVLFICGVLALAGVLYVSFLVLLVVVVLGVIGSMLGGRSSRSTSIRDRLYNTTTHRKGVFFDTPTGERIDDAGNVVQQGLLFDRKTGERIREDGVVVRDGLFGETETDRRYDENGQLLERGIFFDTPTGVKVTEDGTEVTQGVWFDSDTGIQRKKES
jgi:hypothetical protein